jgi:hypothetical protein
MDISNNTIEPIKISGEEYVIIKNLKKDYEKKKTKIVYKIFTEIRNKNNKNHLKDNTEKNI